MVEAVYLPAFVGINLLVTKNKIFETQKHLTCYIIILLAKFYDAGHLKVGHIFIYRHFRVYSTYIIPQFIRPKYDPKRFICNTYFVSNTLNKQAKINKTDTSFAHVYACHENMT